MARHTAFEILYKEYYVRVFGLCRRLLNAPELAEDATQETFMRAYRNFNKFKSDQPFWQWIAAIANNYCIDLLRQRSRTDQLFGDEATESEELASEESLDHAAILTEESEAIGQAISELPDKYRVPLVLAYFHQISYGEIAAQLNINTNHVGILLLRAKQQLRRLLATTAEETTRD